ncbi:hypothetical protein L9F63_025523 [Diploptera punctata]|uniref:Uncharacterized protein n=1 Tax=Diploptera punctata TaxID=6984 RepID=A0AAD8E451_DIPPU|nr:hypothetical protein L9F63_025523 [Diploptera punctata]
MKMKTVEQIVYLTRLILSERKTENTAVQSSLLSKAVSSYVDQDVNEEVVLRKVPSFSSECNYQNEIHIKSEHDMNKQPENSEKNNEAKIESSISP